VKNSNQTLVDNRKQAVSIRMNRTDVRNVKRLALRLGARDSDVIRFAIKLMLSRLALLQDSSIRGRNLVPVFLECGPELIRHFELDTSRLSNIINEGVEAEACVDPADIHLIAMNGLQRSYVKLRAATFRRAHNAAAAAVGTDAPAAGGPTGNGEPHRNGNGAIDDDSLEDWLRQYLYDKYLYTETKRNSNQPNPGGEP
jgi:hypothetical protein